MTRFIFMALVVSVLTVGCAPRKETFTYYKANGANSRTYFLCGHFESWFSYSLRSGMTHRIEVGVNHENIVSVNVVNGKDNSFQLNPSRIYAQVDGRTLRPGKTYISPKHTTGLSGKLRNGKATAKFNFGTAVPMRVVIFFEPGAIRINGVDFPLAPMSFDRVTETHAWMATLNC